MIRSRHQNDKPSSLKEIVFDQKMFYTIECKSNSFKLREELKSYKMQEGDKVHVIGGEHGQAASELLSFLWMFKYHPHEKDRKFQIIHARTNLALKTEDYQCCLTDDRQPQYFTMDQATNTLFKIRDRYSCYLKLDGILQTTEITEKDSEQEFSIRGYRPESIPQLLGTDFLRQRQKGLVLSLNDSFKQGEEEIIVEPLNYRMSQRWFLVKVEEEANIRTSVDRSQTSKKLKFYIRSVLTQQFVSYNRQKKKLVQSSYPQQWRIDFRNEQSGKFYIEHVKLNSYLGCRQNRLELSTTEHHEWEIPESMINHSMKRQFYRNSI